MQHSVIGRSLLIATLMMIGSGCGGGDGIKRVKVTGTVTAEGSIPFANGQIFFTPKDNRAKIIGGGALTDENGQYSVRHAKGQMGIEPGEYIVWFSKYLLPDGSELPEQEEDGEPKQPWEMGGVQFVDSAYSNAQSTKNIVTVSSSGETLDFTIPELKPQSPNNSATGAPKKNPPPGRNR